MQLMCLNAIFPHPTHASLLSSVKNHNGITAEMLQQIPHSMCQYIDPGFLILTPLKKKKEKEKQNIKAIK